MKKNIVVLLVIALFAGMIPDTGTLAKANHVKLARKSAVLSVTEDEDGVTYETARIKIKKISGVNILKTSYLSKNKKTASVSAKGKVKAKKEGNARITVTVRYKYQGQYWIKKLPFSVKVEEVQDFSGEDDLDFEDYIPEAPEPEPVQDHGIPDPLPGTDLTVQQTDEPAEMPGDTPGDAPEEKPLEENPTINPTAKPTMSPKVTVKPTAEPTVKPTEKPTIKPTVKPTAIPTMSPKVTLKPTVKPTEKPIISPRVTWKPTVKPTEKPTIKPTVKPTAIPTIKPTLRPTVKPTIRPTIKPTATPLPYTLLANGMYKFSTQLKSGMMLDASGNSTKDNTNIQIYQNNETNAQRFNITHTGSGWYKICNVSSGKALDVTGAEKRPGVNVQIYTYNGTDAQLWRFHAAENGYVYIQNKLGYYLDVDGAKTANNTNVLVYTKNGTGAQKWKPMPVIFPAGISLGASAVTLKKIGETKKLSVTFAPSNVTQKGITWTSSDPKVATVANGTVTAVGSGTATITAKTENGKTASQKVTVNDGCATITTGYYSFNTKAGSGFMLDVSGNGTSDGSNIQIYQNNGSAAQKFYVEPVGNGWYMISNTVPKKCLDVQGASSQSGTNVQLYHNNGSDAQKWRFYSVGGGYYTIMNKGGCYLDVNGGSAKNNTNVQVYTYNGSNAQQWKLTSTRQDYVNMADSLYCIKSQVGGNMTLDVNGNGAADGTNIQVYAGNNSIAQKFKIQSTGDGWFKIVNPFSGKCLDVQGGSPKSGTNVQLYGYNGSDAQKWRFYPEGDCFAIKNKLGCYLDVDGGKNKNGTNVLAYAKNGSNAQKWKVTETSAIIVNPECFTLDGIGKTKNLSVTYEPARVFAAKRSLTWSSSNTKIATVSNGVVKATGAGTVTITAKAFNGQTYAVTVTVKSGAASGSQGLQAPVPAGCRFSKKTSDGGWYGYHDINKGVAQGTPVYAIADGTVTFMQAYTWYNNNTVQKLTSYGNYIEFQSANKVYKAKYCHLNGFAGVSQKISSASTVQASGRQGTHTLGSRTVKKGEVIGYIGTTGNSSGTHLHFELYQNGTRIDPTSVFKGLC